MKNINNEIVFSNNIKRILNGVNAFDYKYKFIPDDSIIEDVRDDFFKSVNKIFNGNVTIVSEDEMLDVNNLIRGDYPHCYV